MGTTCAHPETTSPPGDGNETPARSRSRFTIAVWIVCALLIVLLFNKWFSAPREIKDFVDLLVYQGSIRDLIDHGTLYDFVNDQQLPFTYPPFAGLVLFPIAFVNSTVLAYIWTGLIIAGTGYLAYLVAPQVARRLAQHWEPARWRRTPVLPLTFITMLVIGPIQSNLENGQVSLFVILATLVDAMRVVPERYRGVATGVAAAVKIVPLIFVPYLWITGQRRAAITATGTFAACTGLSWLILPGDSTRYWFTELWEFNRVDPHHSFGNISLKSMIPWTRASSTGQLVLWLLLALVIAAVAFYRAKRADAAGNAVLGAAIIGAASVVISPVSWEHHAVWLAVAICAVPFRNPQKWQQWAIICIIVLTLARPYYMISATYLTGSNLAALIAAVLASKVQLYFAIAVACLIPFQELRSRPKSDDDDPARKDDLANASLSYS